MKNFKKFNKTALYPTVNSINNVSAGGILQKLLELDLSKNSFKALLSDLRHFTKWYEEANGEQFHFERVLPMDVLDYKNHSLRTLNHQPSTINRRLANLRLIFRIASEEGLIEQNPAEKAKSLPLPSLAPKSLNQQEARRFLKELELRGSLRDKAMIYLMLYAGLRASEVIDLKRQDLEIGPRSGELTVHASKGNKTRVVPLNSKLRPILLEYMEHTSGPECFRGERGPLKTVIALNKIVEKYAHFAKVKCSPHSFRHTFAHNYLERNTGDLVGLAQILGHTNIQTTAIYTQNRMEDLQERVEID